MSDSLTTTVARTVMPELSSNGHAESGQAVRSMEWLGVSPWKCYCGKLARLKFRGVRCIICRTECLIKQTNDTLREYEMAEWLASDYQHIGIKNAIHLTLHTRRLVQIIKDLDT